MTARRSETIETREQMDRATAQFFASVFRGYMEASDEVQEGIKAMAAIVNDPEADQEEKEAAIDTLIEALFPHSHNGGFGIDLKECDDLQPQEIKDQLADIDIKIATFADRVRDIMDERGINQEQLADAIGVGQPAVSMMLNRNCRPQRKTIAKIANALGVSPDDLWVI